MQTFKTAKEIAQSIGVTSHTVRRWARSGKVNSYKDSREKLIFIEGEVEKQIATNRKNRNVEQKRNK